MSDIYIKNIPVDLGSFIVGSNEVQSSSIWVNDTEQLISVINLAYFFNTYMFTIYFANGAGQYDALLPSEPAGQTVAKDNVVRAFADNYVLGGCTYSITLY